MAETEQQKRVRLRKLRQQHEAEEPLREREMQKRHRAVGLPEEYTWTYKDNRGDRTSTLRCGEEVIAVIRQDKMHKPSKPDRDQYTAQIRGKNFGGAYDGIEIARNEITKEVALSLEKGG